MSLIAPQMVRKHQANSSTSKSAFKFPQTERFKAPNPECKQAFYRTHASELSLRKAAFGYGTKSDFTKDKLNTPAPTNYEMKSTFELSRQKGKSFGISREVSPDQNYTIPQMQKVPGPGQYQHKSSTLSPVKYSLRNKPKDFIAEKLTYKKSPGPGAYETINMDPESGRFKLSKYGDCKFAKIQPKLPRFKEPEKPTVAFFYDQQDNMGGKGKYIQSKHKGSGTRAFSMSGRKTFIDDTSKSVKKLPGPGNYDKPSDFGIYGSYGDNLWATKRAK